MVARADARGLVGARVVDRIRRPVVVVRGGRVVGVAESLAHVRAVAPLAAARMEGEAALARRGAVKDGVAPRVRYRRGGDGDGADGGDVEAAGDAGVLRAAQLELAIEAIVERAALDADADAVTRADKGGRVPVDVVVYRARETGHAGLSARGGKEGMARGGKVGRGTQVSQRSERERTTRVRGLAASQ